MQHMAQYDAAEIEQAPLEKLYLNARAFEGLSGPLATPFGSQKAPKEGLKGSR